jgi:hypothetical protein
VSANAVGAEATRAATIMRRTKPFLIYLSFLSLEPLSSQESVRVSDRG